MMTATAAPAAPAENFKKAVLCVELARQLALTKHCAECLAMDVDYAATRADLNKQLHGAELALSLEDRGVLEIVMPATECLIWAKLLGTPPSNHFVTVSNAVIAGWQDTLKSCGMDGTLKSAQSLAFKYVSEELKERADPKLN